MRRAALRALAGIAVVAGAALTAATQPAAAGQCRPESEYRFYSGHGLLGRHVPIICPPEKLEREETQPYFSETYRATVRVPVKAGSPEKVTRLSDVAPYLGRCWEASGFRDDRRTFAVTVRVSFRADGSLIGTPRIVYGTPSPNDEGQQAFVSAVINAIARCTPLPLAGGFERAIAGRPYLIRFVGGKPEEKT